MCTSAQCYSCVWLFATLWTIACQAPQFMGFSRPRILEWAGISSSRGFFPARDWTQVSCISFSESRFFTVEPPGRPHWPRECLNPSMQTLLSPRSGNNLLWLLFQPLGLLIFPLLAIPFRGRWCIFEAKHFHQPISCCLDLEPLLWPSRKRQLRMVHDPFYSLLNLIC